jgi:hypothetical protein
MVYLFMEEDVSIMAAFEAYYENGRVYIFKFLVIIL